MSEEGFVLARRGLPLAGSVPAQPRAAWLPAAVRSRVQPVAPRREPVLPAVEEEEAQDEDGAWWDGSGAGAQSDREPVRGEAAVPGAAAGERLQPQETVVQAGSAQTRTQAREEPVGKHAMPALDDAPRAAFAPPPESVVPSARAASLRVDPPPAAGAEVVASATNALAPPPAGQPMRAAGHAPHAPDPAQPPWPLAAFAPAESAPAAPPLPAERDTASPLIGKLQPAPASAPPAEPRATVAARPLAADRARGVTRHEEPTTTTETILMGLAADAAGEPPPQRNATDLTVLLAPAPAPQRSVTIDRIAVTVQAPAAARTVAAASAPSSAPQRAAAAPAPFRNPWASYHARRD